MSEFVNFKAYLRVERDEMWYAFKNDRTIVTRVHAAFFTAAPETVRANFALPDQDGDGEAVTMAWLNEITEEHVRTGRLIIRSYAQELKDAPRGSVKEASSREALDREIDDFLQAVQWHHELRAWQLSLVRELVGREYRGYRTWGMRRERRDHECHIVLEAL